ncbi:hypothetical protein Lal_00001220 [Lupinus albus]|uniref:Putative PMR5 domain, PC-Esterase n=1 Tax=Lupinus albus TaxID=3870 RepID=A0A6A5P1M5_LUPAL|nr:putative PMR5 domain, PC-Esterase [Lupinus albus]KAF1891081.1 hypothetical protein Lal_00001220 [Lupinus albus]
MKFEVPEIFKCNYTPRNIPKGVFLLPLTLLIIVVLFPLIRNLNLSSYKIYSSRSETTPTTTSTTTRTCNISIGNWKPYLGGPYYNNETCHFMNDRQNCLKQGRPDRDFMKLRWKPNECELPLFDATLFLKLVKGKSMVFVGDSIGRNQMDSLLCLLNTVAHPEDVTTKYALKDENYFKWWFYADYNFTLAILWSPFLVKSDYNYLNDTAFYKAQNLYLDEADKAWVSQIENSDYVIISTGQWFFRPLTFYENGQIVGCQRCQENMTEPNLYGYRFAFRTALRTIGNLKGFKGMTFLVTHSPNHFENGDWYNGGACNRKKPFTKEERHEYERGYFLKELYQIQVEEFRAAEKEGRKKGLNFGLIDISEVMSMRPDGHPNRYGNVNGTNKKINDCVHWCLPGPVDTWNEFLLYMMRLES